jgi:O-antigen chain-terminating methyltransferase
VDGDDHVAPGAGPPHDGGGAHTHSELTGLRRVMKALFDRTPWGRRLNQHLAVIQALSDRVEALTVRLESRLDAAEDALRGLQAEIAEVRDRRVPAVELRLDAAEGSLAATAAEATRLRDEVVPAMVGRSDVLLERLAGELDEVASLVERLALAEPLPVAAPDGVDSSRLAAALAEVQPALLEAFRGGESEIRHRLERYLAPLRESSPVLDLGCGRGELLLLLREAGVPATGVEGDPALAGAARRRGLEVVEGDVLEALRGLPEASRGAVTAIHLLEHLDAGHLLAVLAEVRRVLRPGGLLIAECPNPHSLRVGAALFWIDPTHRRPLPPESLELFLRTSGLVVERRELLHPFPEEQLFAVATKNPGATADPSAAELARRLETLGRRLDELVNGPRDFVVWARRPGGAPS